MIVNYELLINYDVIARADVIMSMKRAKILLTTEITNLVYLGCYMNYPWLLATPLEGGVAPAYF